MGMFRRWMRWPREISTLAHWGDSI